MMTDEEKRRYNRKVGYITGIIGAIIALAIIILSTI